MKDFTKEQWKKVQDISRGEFVRKNPQAKITYKRGQYDRSTKRFALEDTTDISREVYVKRDTQLWVGFTY